MASGKLYYVVHMSTNVQSQIIINQPYLKATLHKLCKTLHFSQTNVRC